MKIKGQIPRYSEHQVGILDEMWQKSQELMEACDELARDGRDNAEKKDTLAREKAKAFLLSQGKNKEERESKADAYYADARKDAYLAEAAKEAQLEKVRSLRQVLSALQTIANSSKAEADAIHYGQDGSS
jgi:hypothetical protein